MLLVILSNIIYDIYKYIDRKGKWISFKESIDLAELPVITFYQGTNKFNFLLDTGSNYSHISPSASKLLKADYNESFLKISGIGSGESNIKCSGELYYKKSKYIIELYVTPHLDNAFDTIKKETGVKIHGILGNQFFQKYKYVLDFDKLIAYSK